MLVDGCARWIAILDEEISGRKEREMQSISPCGYRRPLIVGVPYLQLGGTARLEVALGRC